MRNNFEERLMKIAKECGIELNSKEAQILGDFKEEVLKWNTKVNLTTIVEEEQFIVKHIIDSLMILKNIHVPHGAKLVDVGTGAGFPGIPLKVVRKDLQVTLIDSSRKKTEFLKFAVKKLNLDKTNVLCARAESAGKSDEFREKYDIAVARAVSALNILSELCLPLVKVEGIFIAMKGEDPYGEIEDAEGAIKVLGGKILEVIPYELPGGIKRRLIVVKKVENTPDKYPRREGVPEKRPIKLEKFP
ncbi:MAG: 16S rRNA (guanine(527)-N(7))-methyltransferase RsmG [Thermosediminibacteraceae bacterium]|nr:16S rRNA (guanine(527)-N(7))-methyltransferase RsmG [Thermosediminibacteraceae bacterium]